MAVGAPHGEEVPSRIDPDLVDDLPESDELTGTSGHGDLFPTPQQIHELDQEDLKVGLITPEGLNSSLHPRNVAMMICSPYIYDHIKSPIILVLVIGNIGRKIGGNPVAPYQHTILVVRESRSLEPGGSLRIKCETVLLEGFKHPGDPDSVIKRLLRKPHIKGDAKIRKVLLDALQDHIACIVAEEQK